MCSEAAEEGCTSKALEAATAQLPIILKIALIVIKICSMYGSTKIGSGLHTSCKPNTRLV